MTISIGDKLPEAKFLKMSDDGPSEVSLSSLTTGRKVVIFGLPGAFTGTCHTAHIPSFLSTREEFAKKGVDEVVCVTVNDPFVVKAWDEATGASAGGITILGDSSAEFTKAIKMDFTAPPVGLISRSKRYAMLVEDGEVKVLHLEENPGVCDVSGGPALLAAL